jgi:transposase-like protein
MVSSYEKGDTMAKRYSREIHEEIVRLYQEGMSGTDVARRFGLPRSPVYRALRKAGIVPCQLSKNAIRLGTQGGYRRFDNPTEATIRKRYANGDALDALAEEYQCARPTIVQILHRGDTEPRRRGARGRELTDQEIAALVQDYKNGRSLSFLIRAYHRSAETIKSLIHVKGLTWRKLGVFDNLDEAAREDLVRRGLAGESQSSLAQRYGVDQRTISRWMKALKCPVGRNAARGRGHGHWNDGILTTHGYRYVMLLPDDPYISMCNSTGYVAEHRYVMAKHLGRLLLPTETVHHIRSEDKLNNDISNLQLRIGRHGIHSAYRCLDCGSSRIGPVPLANGPVPEQLQLLEG